jgi:hypothetical protein
MKVGVITLMTALLFAWPALAGDPCTGPDTDSDGHVDICDNCDAIPNALQTDSDSDGYGNFCDCDYDQNNACAGSDFLILGLWFGQSVPPCPPYVDQDVNLACAGSDFLLFGAGFGQPPGTSCGHAKGTPCP